MKAVRSLPLVDVALLLAVNVLWGSTYVVARNVLDAAPPLVLAFFRLAVASLCLALLRWHRAPRQPEGQDTHTTPSEAWSIVIVGVVGFGLAKLLNYEGLACSTATDAALIINMEAVFTAVFAAMVLGQRLTAGLAGGLVVAFAGGVALVWPEQGGGTGAGRAFGNLLMVGSVAAEAVASVLGVRAMRRYSGLQVTARATYWGTAVLLPLAAWQWHGTGWRLDWVTPGNALAILYLALGATVLAYALWFRALERVEAGRAAAFLYVQPLVGLLLGFLIRGERPTVLGAVGGLLVLLGIFLTTRTPQPKATAAPPAG